MELTGLNALQAKPNTRTNKDLDELEDIALQAKYPSEANTETPLANTNKNDAYIKIKGREVHYTTITIDPTKTKLYEGNPRNFAVGVDISDLAPLIKESKGNTVPVWARKLSKPDENGIDIEIIAGLRRRLSCIEVGENLTIDLIDDINEEEALHLAEIENSGRKNTDFFAECRYLKYLFDKLKALEPATTVESFADKKKIARQTMSEKLKLGILIEDWLLIPVQDHNSWSFRKGIRLKTLFNKLLKENRLSELKKELEGKAFTTADKLLYFVEVFTKLSQSVYKEDFALKGGVATIKDTGKGHLSISLDKNVPLEIKEKIIKMVKKEFD